MLSVGQVFMLISVVLFALAALHVPTVPNAPLWGAACFGLGWLTSGIPLWRRD